MTPITQTSISTTDYFALAEYAQHDLIQLIAGEVVIGMPPTPQHQDIVRELLVLFTLIARQTGGKAYDSPIEVVLDAQHVFQPDVLYLKPDSACVVGEKRLVGPPDLVVEVLSPSTARIDRQQKHPAYARFGVGEYWIVDPVQRLIEVWLRAEPGNYARQGIYGQGDTFASPTLGQDIDADALLRA